MQYLIRVSSFNRTICTDFVIFIFLSTETSVFRLFQRIHSEPQRRESPRSEQSSRHTRSRLPNLPRCAGDEFQLQRRTVRTRHVRQCGDRMSGTVA